MRIGQAAHVEHQVGIERDAVLEAEGLEQQDQPAALVLPDKILDAGAQRIGPQVAGVDVVAERGQHFQRLAFARDGFFQRHVVAGQRMAPAGFGKALDQHIVARIEEDEAQRDALRLQLAQLRRQRRDARPAAHVHRHGDQFVLLRPQVADQVRQQRRRQVVHAVIAGIFQHIECNGFAGTGKTADEYDLHGRKDSGLLPAAAVSPCLSAPTSPGPLPDGTAVCRPSARTAPSATRPAAAARAGPVRHRPGPCPAPGACRHAPGMHPTSPACRWRRS